MPLTATELREIDQSSPRYQRARRFANTVHSVLSDFIPDDRAIRRRVNDYLFEVGYQNNLEIINVPPELDALNKLELQHRMLETHPAFIRGMDMLSTKPQGS